MANKAKGKKAQVVIQQVMFDIPAVSQAGNHSTKQTKKLRIVSSIDTRYLGLNAIHEGRSENFATFGDYIKSKTNQNE